MSNSATPWTAARQASLSITNSQSLLKLTSIESVMPSNHDFSMSKEIFWIFSIHTAGGGTSGPFPADMLCWATVPTADTRPPLLGTPPPHCRAECFGISEVLWKPKISSVLASPSAYPAFLLSPRSPFPLLPITGGATSFSSVSFSLCVCLRF